MLSVSSLLPASPVTNASFSTQPALELDRVSLRLTPIAVTAPLQNERVADNNRQAANRQALAQPTPQQAAANNNAPVRDSAAYVAQAISQSENVAPAVTLGAFSPFAPALQYNKLVSYSLVKYKPSDAGLPTGRSTPASNATPSEAATEYQAYNNTQLRNLSELASNSAPIIIAG